MHLGGAARRTPEPGFGWVVELSRSADKYSVADCLLVVYPFRTNHASAEDDLEEAELRAQRLQSAIEKFEATHRQWENASMDAGAVRAWEDATLELKMEEMMAVAFIVQHKPHEALQHARRALATIQTDILQELQKRARSGTG